MCNKQKQTKSDCNESGQSLCFGPHFWHGSSLFDQIGLILNNLQIFDWFKKINNQSWFRNKTKDQTHQFNSSCYSQAHAAGRRVDVVMLLHGDREYRVCVCVCVWICAVCGTTEPSACVNVTRNIKPQGSLEEQTHAWDRRSHHLTLKRVGFTV